MTTTTYGFHARMTAKPGRADELVELLLSGPVNGPASHPSCTIFLVSRSISDPRQVHLVEGWTSEAAHAEVFASPAAQVYIARFAELVADSDDSDFVTVGGKASLTTPDHAQP